MGTYTREILAALERTERPRLLVYGPGAREIPGPRLVGRHFLWPRRLRRLDIDVFFGPAGLLPLAGPGVPSVITVHDLAIYLRPEWFPPGQPFSTRIVVPRSIERADAVIAVSRNTARDLERIFEIGADRVDVIPEGVSESFQPLPPERLAEVRDRYQLPERFILFVGTLEPRKNVTTLVDAWEALPRGERPELVVAGGWGWRTEAIRARLERAGSGLRLLGSVPYSDLPALYNLATVLAHPAHYEGFGLTPLEAMACGTPVICSNAASLPEVVGSAALTAPPDDVQAWTAALERVLQEPELGLRLRAQGLLRAAEFTWERAARQTYSVLQRTASPARS